jgi:hypothetical protein
MYAAYQSGQFASLPWPIRASYLPWAASARRNALARSFADAKVVAAESMRPASRVVTSWNSHRCRPDHGTRQTSGSCRARIRTAGPTPPEEIGLVRAGVHAVAVEHLAHLDAATAELVAGGRDVGDDQVQALSGARRRRGDVLAEDDRAPGAGRRELDHAEVVTAGELGVEPPPEPP